jgi:2-octaprenyl-6-methoxyphenol hydroxylase
MTDTCYGQSALIANVATVKLHNNIAYERFTDTGPIAMLPLSSVKEGENRCSLVWTLTPELADEMSLLNDEEFKQALESNFGSWLGGITEVGKRNVYPLKLVQAQEQVYHRTVLIGNATHTIHPIAGQGFNLGLRDVQELTDEIKVALHENQDIGLFSLLSGYAQQREKDHQQVISLTDSLVTLFSNQLEPLVVGRNVGLKMLNYLSPIKSALVKKTKGY